MSDLESAVIEISVEDRGAVARCFKVLNDLIDSGKRITRREIRPVVSSLYSDQAEYLLSLLRDLEVQTQRESEMETLTWAGKTEGEGVSAEDIIFFEQQIVPSRSKPSDMLARIGSVIYLVDALLQEGCTRSEKL